MLTPITSLEKAVQFIKGGFSYRVKKELRSNMEVWQKGFSDHRVRDADDYLRHVLYIQENPLRKHLCERAEEFPYSSAHPGFELDPVPQGLKPAISTKPDAARLEVVPFQTDAVNGAAEAAPFQSTRSVAPEGATLQSKPAVSAAITPPQYKTGKDRIINATPH
jgi:putative transposase